MLVCAYWSFHRRLRVLDLCLQACVARQTNDAVHA